MPSSIGEERRSNPFAAFPKEEEFIEFALADLGSYPTYYRYMADINRRGPDVLGSVPRLAFLTALSAHHQLEEGAVLLDARPQKESNQEHIPGAFAIPYGITWLLGSAG